MATHSPRTERLTFHPLGRADVEAFERLATDAHVRRFLFDGVPPSRDACLETLEASERRFSRDELGLWRLRTRDAPDTDIGFCGFHVFPELDPAPELVFALLGAFTGRGLACEAARAGVEAQQRLHPRASVRATVDAPNVASIRVLEKLGFVRVSERTGAFGALYVYSLPGGS